MTDTSSTWPMLHASSFTDGWIIGLEPLSTTETRLVEIGVDNELIDEHLESLPSLEELSERFRKEDPAFDRRMASARRARYEELLDEVAAGLLRRLTAERLRAGLTQSELAERAGMAQPNISRLEKPGAPMTVTTARKLGEALGLDDYKVLLP